MPHVVAAALLLLLMALSPAAQADRPKLAIIIDDLGDRAHEDRRAVALPVPLTCAILPHTPFASDIARSCHAKDKQVMLHLPLEAKDHNELLGPGKLTLDQDEEEFRETFREALASVPETAGVNNHMGSLMTRHPGAMTWLMEELDAHDLYFVDSWVTPRSVALDMAREQRVPAGRRDVFLDEVREPEAIEAALEQAVRRALRNGEAIAIGHPYPETMEVLERRLPFLETETGIRLVTADVLAREADAEDQDEKKDSRQENRTGEES